MSEAFIYRWAQWRSGSGLQNWAISFSEIYAGIMGNTTSLNLDSYNYLPCIYINKAWSSLEYNYSPSDNSYTKVSAGYRLGIGI